MPEDSAIWIGKDEHEGVLAQPRKDLKPPPHWRVEAVAHTPMPRTLRIGADRRRAVFIQDADTSDVWLLDLDAGGPPERLTTGRDPVPSWAECSRGSRRTGRRWHTGTGARCGSWPPRADRRAS